MTKAYPILILLFAMVVIPMQAEDWTVNGKDYHNVKIGQVEPDRVHITYDGGIGTVMIADLTPDLKKRFNYDPTAARATSDERAKQEAQSDAVVASVTQQKAKQDAEQQSQARQLEEAKKNAVHVEGEVLQKTPDGLLIDGEVDTKEVNWGNVKFLLKGCDMTNVVDGQHVGFTAYPSGTYSYTTVMGAQATVRTYTAMPAGN